MFLIKDLLLYLPAAEMNILKLNNDIFIWEYDLEKAMKRGKEGAGSLLYHPSCHNTKPSPPFTQLRWL
jgi:hypothetical protein